MRRLTKTFFGLSVFAGVLSFAAMPGLAANAVGTGAVKSGPPAQEDAPTRAYEMIATQQSAGAFHALTTATYTPIDKPKTLVCPGPAKCRIEADMWASLDEGKDKANPYALCGVVDNAFMAEPDAAALGCPFAGFVPADGSLTSTMQIQSQSQLAPGPHKVQFFVLIIKPANLAAYQAVYHLYSVRGQ